MVDGSILIDYDPYSFVYSIKDEVGNENLNGFGVYNNFRKLVLPMPTGLKMSLKDISKTHFNLSKATTVQLSASQASLELSWQAMESVFEDTLKSLLSVSRLLCRISFDRGINFIEGEIKTNIKTNHLTGYNDIHASKISLIFLTKLTENLLPKVFGDFVDNTIPANALTTQDGTVITTQDGTIIEAG